MRLPKLFVVAAIASLLRLAAWAEEETDTLKMTDLPQPVRAAIRAEVGKGRVASVEKTTDDSDIVYDVEMRKNGKLRNYTFDSEGTLLDREVFMDEVPAAVQDAIKKQGGAAEIQEITKTVEEGKTSYEVDFGSEDNPRSFTLDENGGLLEKEMLLTETPGPVREAIRRELAGKTPSDITETFDEGETAYEVEVESGKSHYAIAIDPSGKVVSKEEDITPAGAPEGVQKAVHEMTKDGKLGTLSKITEDGEVTYDVDFKHGGKWQTTTLDSDGKTVQ
jgi:uncharacterized membrane protein YkoI